MPRVSRNEVVFEGPDGKAWKAKFLHQHSKDKNGGVVHHTIEGKTVVVQHVTTCRLSSADKPNIFVTGISLCSLKDKYRWKHGIRRAFQKALERAHLCKIVKEAGVEKVIGLKPGYGLVMRNFFAELPKKTYWPHDPAAPKPLSGSQMRVLEGEVVVPITVSATIVPPPIPPENRHGLAHIGSMGD